MRPKFWGVKVEADKPVCVTPRKGIIYHISQVALGKVDDLESAKSVEVRMTANKKNQVIGRLSAEETPQINLGFVLETEFVFSHNWKGGTVHFCGYSANQIEDMEPYVPTSDDEADGDGWDDSDDDDEDESKAAATDPGPSAKPKNKPSGSKLKTPALTPKSKTDNSQKTGCKKRGAEISKSSAQFSCKFCNKKLKSKEAVYNHTKDKHSGK